MGLLFVAVQWHLTEVASLAVEHRLQHVGSALWLTGLVAPRHSGSSQTRDQAHVPHAGRQIPNHWTTRKHALHIFNTLANMTGPTSLLLQFSRTCCLVTVHTFSGLSCLSFSFYALRGAASVPRGVPSLSWIYLNALGIRHGLSQAAPGLEKE